MFLIPVRFASVCSCFITTSAFPVVLRFPNVISEPDIHRHMDDDVDFQVSQDIFAEVSQQVGHATANIVRPWIKDLRCEEASQDEVPLWEPLSANSSKQIPSIRDLQFLPGVLEFGKLWMPVAEIFNARGISGLFLEAMRLAGLLRTTRSLTLSSEFNQTIWTLEYIGCCVDGLPEDVRLEFHNRLRRLLQKTNLLFEYQSKQAVGNEKLHVVLQTWRFAFAILSRYEISASQQQSRACLSLKELLIIVCNGMVNIWKKHGSVVPCSCVQSFLIELLQQPTFMEVLMAGFYSSTTGNSDTHSLPKSFTPISSMDYLKFYIDCLHRMCAIKAFGDDGDSEMAVRFLARLFKMIEQLADTHILNTKLIDVCALLSPFFQQNKLAALERSKSTKTIRMLWKKIVEYLVDRAHSVPELERLPQGPVSEWATQITQSFPNMENREIHLIRTMVVLLKVPEHWRSMRSDIFNQFNGSKIAKYTDSPVSSFGAIMSLLLSLTSCDGFAVRLREWLCVGFSEGSPALMFAAAETLLEVAERMEIEEDLQPAAMFSSFLSSLRLPANGELFIQQYTRLSKRYCLTGIMMDTVGEAMAEHDFVRLLPLIGDSDVQGKKTWQRAKQMMSSGAVAPDVVTFVAKQLRVGLTVKTNYGETKDRLRRLLDEVAAKKSTMRTADVIIPLCNVVLSFPRDYTLSSEMFIPLWIYAVCEFSDTHELEVCKLTHHLWEMTKEELLQKGGVGFRLEVDSFEPSSKYVERLIDALSELSSPVCGHRIWVMERMKAWFPPTIAELMRTILTQPFPSIDYLNAMQERSLSFSVHLIAKLSPLFYEQTIGPGKNVNGTTFHLLLGILCDKKLAAGCPDVWSSNVSSLIEHLCRLPSEHIFVRARVKELLAILQPRELKAAVETIRRHQRLLDYLVGDAKTKPIIQPYL